MTAIDAEGLLKRAEELTSFQDNTAENAYWRVLRALQAALAKIEAMQEGAQHEAWERDLHDG